MVKWVEKKSMPLTAPALGSSVFFPTSIALVSQIYFLFPAEIPEQSGLSWEFFVSVAVAPFEPQLLADGLNQHRKIIFP